MFSPQQLTQLGAPLSRDSVKTRSQSGRSLSYIEGWHAIAEANRIFGFDGWTRETVTLNCVSEREREIGKDKLPGWGVTYIAKVRVAVGDVVREGCGSGHGIDRDLGQAHESALKEAETDAMKRALMTFGNPFGLALYDKDQSNVSDTNGHDLESKRVFIDLCKRQIEVLTPAQIEAWWTSDDHKKSLRLHDLTQAEVDELKQLIAARIGKRAA